MTEIEERHPSPMQPDETWEQYARRLEGRIAEQRIALRTLHAHKKDGNKYSKKRVEFLERALGQSEARGFKRREARVAMHRKLIEAKAENEALKERIEELLSEEPFVD